MDAKKGIEGPQPDEARSNGASESPSQIPSLENSALSAVEVVEDGEPTAPMPIAHVHPQHGIHSWRDFFVSIAVVAIGLLLALGLEQGVEYVHHRSQRVELEKEMRATFEADIKILPKREKKLANFRSYLTDIRKAVVARLVNQPASNAPMETDPRNDTLVPPPNLGPFNAAKANGTVALLELGRIRIYERIEFQHTLVLDDFRQFYVAVNELRAFRQRFDLPPVKQPRGVTPVDLTTLSTPQLIEYQALLGNAIQGNTLYGIQLRRLDSAYRAVLNGARNDDEVVEAALKEAGASTSVSQ
jgi:hypothetical protein